MVEKYREIAPKLAEWIKANLPEGLAVFGLTRGSPPEDADLEPDGAAQQEDQAADSRRDS